MTSYLHGPLLHWMHPVFDYFINFKLKSSILHPLSICKRWKNFLSKLLKNLSLTFQGTPNASLKGPWFLLGSVQVLCQHAFHNYGLPPPLGFGTLVCDTLAKIGHFRATIWHTLTVFRIDPSKLKYHIRTHCRGEVEGFYTKADTEGDLAEELWPRA